MDYTASGMDKPKCPHNVRTMTAHRCADISNVRTMTAHGVRTFRMFAQCPHTLCGHSKCPHNVRTGVCGHCADISNDRTQCAGIVEIPVCFISLLNRSHQQRSLMCSKGCKPSRHHCGMIVPRPQGMCGHSVLSHCRGIHICLHTRSRIQICQNSTMNIRA